MRVDEDGCLDQGSADGESGQVISQVVESFGELRVWRGAWAVGPRSSHSGELREGEGRPGRVSKWHHVPRCDEAGWLAEVRLNRKTGSKLKRRSQTSRAVIQKGSRDENCDGGGGGALAGGAGCAAVGRQDWSGVVWWSVVEWCGVVVVVVVVVGVVMAAGGQARRRAVVRVGGGGDGDGGGSKSRRG
ncbi:hypothetical protein BC567DRAFT_29529 [Phyllosticta citribraziliensis]